MGEQRFLLNPTHFCIFGRTLKFWGSNNFFIWIDQKTNMVSTIKVHTFYFRLCTHQEKSGSHVATALGDITCGHMLRSWHETPYFDENTQISN